MTMAYSQVEQDRQTAAIAKLDFSGPTLGLDLCHNGASEDNLKDQAKRRDTKKTPRKHRFKRGLSLSAIFWQNGAEGIRTPDLLHAMQALSQLSYSPETGCMILLTLGNGQ